MTSEGGRPLTHLPIGAGSAGTPGGGPAPRHETALPEAPAAELAELAAARASGGRAPLAAVAGRHPALLEAWSRLAEAALAEGDVVGAYAAARVAYHRGLDALRRHGWGGTGLVRWAVPGNRGFLRGLHHLLAAAAALGELDESERCRAFLLDLDPSDPLGVAGYPLVPGPGFTPPALPEDGDPA